MTDDRVEDRGLSVVFRDIKTISHKKWAKQHCDCYVKKSKVLSPDGEMKFVHCKDHNELFILSFQALIR